MLRHQVISRRIIKEFVILLILEIYLMETFARVCSDGEMLIVTEFNKIVKLGKCFLPKLCQIHAGLIFLAMWGY